MTKILSLITLLFASVLSGYAQYGEKLSDATSHLECLTKNHDGLVSIESDFVRTQHVVLMQDDQKSHGRFFYRADNHVISMEYTEPAGNKIVISDEEIKTIISGKRSTMKYGQNPMMGQIQSMIVACMTGDFLSSYKESEVTYYATDEYFTVVLNPDNKRVNRYMSQIVLRFRTSDYTLSQIYMSGRDGNSTLYEFSNVKNNVNIDDQHFEL